MKSLNLSKPQRLIATFIAGAAVVGSAVVIVPTIQAEPAQAINVCKVVQKKLPWYQCINLRPGTLLPAACYGDVVKCTR